MSFPTKEERKVCWDSRDKYWECLDSLAGGHDKSKESAACNELRKYYESSCPSQWVKHFDRKYDYNKFKEKMEKQGYEPIKAN